MATTKKKRSFDAAFKLRVVEYAEQDTNRGAGRKFGVDEKNCSRSRIVASLCYRMIILVAVASDRANTVSQNSHLSSILAAIQTYAPLSLRVIRVT